ncbi:aminodeoxychorismate/anthranilate synthase component II [Pikeienuella piscinae]|uniref:Aminodeoxychorismate/anthranilate synthase component II n=1 Tax=Pikeienuella piscinae TaxID=2748098 RepID=A0A7L5BTH6_9RHOB|nr:aminodeoxychorismate/anthranilate synthase component II [Pikeienuella piscinae]QIE55330.1 aminodeoxychorismate/anthranilate synthase component II [Pikeienuella piscinae]
MILLIDNYDSFTYNLVHYLGEIGAEIQVRRNDALSAAEAFGMNPEAIVISPGPGVPDQAGICLELVKKAPGDLPILGVCLGHQTIGQGFGGRVVRAGAIMHGKLSPIRHQGAGVFEGAPDPMEATRYHSLIVERESLPDCLAVTAETEDGTIMGLAHKSRPIYGVQFHPESIRTGEGKRLLANFLHLAGVRLAAAA